MAGLVGGSVQGRVALGPRAGARVRRLGDERDAETLGVRGVPAFIAGRRAMVSGVQPVEALRQLIAPVRAAA